MLVIDSMTQPRYIDKNDYKSLFCAKNGDKIEGAQKIEDALERALQEGKNILLILHL